MGRAASVPVASRWHVDSRASGYIIESCRLGRQDRDTGPEVAKQRWFALMSEKKQWIAPEIEEVALESEDEVLATCFTASMSGKDTGVTNCRTGKCATYP